MSSNKAPTIEAFLGHLEIHIFPLSTKLRTSQVIDLSHWFGVSIEEHLMMTYFIRALVNYNLKI